MASELPEDTQLKRRARRRLIGAIALVLVAVIVLPMIFDAEKKPPSGEITIEIPKQDVYVAPPAPAPAVPGGVDAKAVPAPVKAPEPAPKAAEPAKTEAAPVAKAEPKAEETKSTPAKAAADAKAAEAKAAAEVKAAAQVKAAEAKLAETKAAEAKRAEALLNGAGAAPKSEKSADKTVVASGSFAVQIGAFADAEKAQEVRDKLGEAGVKTYVEKVSTKDGERTRVRAGPYASKDAAETARGKVAGLGFKGATVVSR